MEHVICVVAVSVDGFKNIIYTDNKNLEELCIDFTSNLEDVCPDLNCEALKKGLYILEGNVVSTNPIDPNKGSEVVWEDEIIRPATCKHLHELMGVPL